MLAHLKSITFQTTSENGGGSDRARGPSKVWTNIQIFFKTMHWCPCMLSTKYRMVYSFPDREVFSTCQVKLENTSLLLGPLICGPPYFSWARVSPRGSADTQWVRLGGAQSTQFTMVSAQFTHMRIAFMFHQPPCNLKFLMSKWVSEYVTCSHCQIKN